MVKHHNISRIKSGAIKLRKQGSSGQSARPKNSYDGASKADRLMDWSGFGGGPNAKNMDLIELKKRSRDIIFNTTEGTSAIDSFVSNAVGKGIMPLWNIKDREIRRQVQKLWKLSANQTDYRFKISFYGQQQLAARHVFTDGEALGLFRPRPLNFRTPTGRLFVPLQLQLIESDHLDHSINHYLKVAQGSRVIDGLELNGHDDLTHFHISSRHPGDNDITANQIRRIHRNDVIHVYRMLRTGQRRGVPAMTAILIKLYEMNKYADAELLRKQFSAMITAFVEVPELDDDELDNKEADFQKTVAGGIHFSAPGEKWQLSQPADSGSPEWIINMLHGIASAMNITYEQLTGDLKGVSFSSIRAGLMEMRRRILMIQRETIIFQFCIPYVSKWMDFAVASGALNIPDYEEKRHEYLDIDWIPHHFEQVDPLKASMNDVLEVQAGFKHRDQAAIERGNNPEMIDERNKESRERAEEHGNVYLTDLSKVNKQGDFQDKVFDYLKSEQNQDENNNGN